MNPAYENLGVRWKVKEPRIREATTIISRVKAATRQAMPSTRLTTLEWLEREEYKQRTQAAGEFYKNERELEREARKEHARRRALIEGLAVRERVASLTEKRAVEQEKREARLENLRRVRELELERGEQMERESEWIEHGLAAEPRVRRSVHQAIRPREEYVPSEFETSFLPINVTSHERFVVPSWSSERFEHEEVNFPTLAGYASGRLSAYTAESPGEREARLKAIEVKAKLTAEGK